MYIKVESIFAPKAGGRKKAAEQSLRYDVVRWLGYLSHVSHYSRKTWRGVL